MLKKDEKGIPEVNKFMAAKAKLEQFRDKHPKVFAELYSLMEDYNTTLEAAASTVRSTCESHGPFVREKLITKYDAEKLYDALGHKGFLQHGGVVETVTKYSVDKKVFEAQAAGGIITDDLVKEVKQYIPHYKKIEKLVLI